MPHQNLAPVAPQERIQTIDIIRGFALFGILIINFTVDSPGNVAPWDGWIGFGDQVSYWFISFFMDDRFMAIYCFLFGLGFALQMQRAEARNSSFIIVYIRRLIVLYVIGTVHNFFTSMSILPAYALVAILLLFVRKLPFRLIPVLAFICFLGPWVRQVIIQQNNNTPVKATAVDSIFTDTATLKKYVGVYEISPGRRTIITVDSNKLVGEGRGGKGGPLTRKSQTDFVAANGARFTFLSDSAGMITGFILHTISNENLQGQRINMSIEQGQKEMIQQRAAFQQQQRANEKSQDSTYSHFVTLNAKQYLKNIQSWSGWKNFFWFQIREVFPLFLLGFYAGRRKIFYNIRNNKSFLSKIRFWGLLLGIIGISIETFRNAWDYIHLGKMGTYIGFERLLYVLSWNIGVVLMTLGYVAALTLLAEKENWKKRLSFLAPVGRMGLTNYILHTIPIVILFRNFGFGLNDKIGCFYRFLLAIPFAVLIYFLSRWWFKHFSIGPFEWLWRSLTYLKFQPMKIKNSSN